jgi:hypothetical protein
MVLKEDWIEKSYQKTANKKNKTAEFLTALSFLK